MTYVTNILTVIAFAILACAPMAQAWEVQYDPATGLLPTEVSQPWQPRESGTTTSTIADGVLHINSQGGGYRREIQAIAAGVPVTVEARMYLPPSTGTARLAIGTYSGYAPITIYPQYLIAFDVNYQPHIFDYDFGTSRTIRLAYDGSASAYVWVDGQFALSWSVQGWPWSIGPPEGVAFSSYSSDSYWQYVSYSKAFLPIPEPSSLAALAFGIVPLAAASLMRRGL